MYVNIIDTQVDIVGAKRNFWLHYASNSGDNNNMKKYFVSLCCPILIAAAIYSASPVVARVELSDNDIYIIASYIEYYADEGGYACRTALGAVAVNRLENALFPSTALDVVRSLGYSGNTTPSQTSIAAARLAADGYDPTGGALFFYRVGDMHAEKRHGHYVTFACGGYRFATG